MSPFHILDLPVSSRVAVEKLNEGVHGDLALSYRVRGRQAAGSAFQSRIKKGIQDSRDSNFMAEVRAFYYNRDFRTRCMFHSPRGVIPSSVRRATDVSTAPALYREGSTCWFSCARTTPQPRLGELCD
jgi:hypothetical protein